MAPAQKPSAASSGRVYSAFLLVAVCFVLAVAAILLWAMRRPSDPASARVRALLREARGLKHRTVFNPGRPLDYIAKDLAALGSPAVPALAEALRRESDYHARYAATDALGRIGDANALPALRLALRSERNETLCCIAARSMGQIASPSAVPALLAAIKDGRKWVRMMAAGALGEIGDPAAVAVLGAALGDGEAEVRRFAAGALGKIRDARSVEPLVAALRDGDLGVRYFAAGSLGAIGDARALPALRAALQDADKDVRSAAGAAIARLEARAASRPAGAGADGGGQQPDPHASSSSRQ